MRRFGWVAALVLMAAFILAASWSGRPMKITAFASSAPAFDPIAFWTGHVHSWGVVENRAGAPGETIETDCIGTLDAGGLALHQTLTEGDGTTRHRDWHLRRVNARHYTATANDMAGTAEGDAVGRAFHWDWIWQTAPGNALKNVTMHQWMYLMADGSMVNRTIITKLGVTVAQVTEHFAKIPAAVK